MGFLEFFGSGSPSSRPRNGEGGSPEGGLRELSRTREPGARFPDC